MIPATTDFLAYLRDIRNVSPHTLRSYEADLKQFVAWLLGEKLIKSKDGPDKVTYLMIRRYLAHLSGDYQRATTVRKLSVLKAFWKWLEREGRAQNNPAAAVIAPKIQRNLPDVLDAAEVERLLDAPRRDHPLGRRDRALLEWLYSSGARVAETAALDLEMLDWKKSEARIEGGKGGKDRLVLLGAPCLEALKSYVEDWRSELLTRAKMDGGPKPTQAVWINGHGTRLSAHAIYMMVRETAREVGITKEVTPHVLRHSFATHLLEGGADLRVVQELLGHRTLSSTQIYTRVSTRHLQKVYAEAHPRDRALAGEAGNKVSSNS